MTHARSSTARYLAIWLALLALTGLSLALSLAHLGATDVALALAIAAIKAALVVLFFMHLSEERFSVAMLPMLGVLLFLLLTAIVVTDVATRRTFPRAPSIDVGELPGKAD